MTGADPIAEAVGHFALMFNWLEINVHALASGLINSRSSRVAGIITHEMPMGTVLKLIGRLTRAAEQDSALSQNTSKQLLNLVEQLENINADRNALLHSLHGDKGEIGARVRRLIRASGAITGDELRAGGWPLDRVLEANERLRTLMVDTVEVGESVRAELEAHFTPASETGL